MTRITDSRFRFIRCMCCGMDYAYQSGRLIQQCRCSEKFCRRCNQCEDCCKCEDGPQIDRRPHKYGCYECTGVVEGTENFCPHCGTDLKKT